MVIHNDIINKFVPFKSTALVNNKPLRINKEVKCALCKKRESWMDWKKQPSTQKLDDYIRKRNEATFIKSCKKEKFEEKLVEGMKDDKNKFYSYVRNKTKIKERICSVTKPDGKLTTSDVETANVLNTAFHSVFSKEDKSTKSSHQKILKNYDLFSSISGEEILKRLIKLVEGKAAGPDEVTSIVLKRCRLELTEPLCITYNKSIKDSVIPSLWRQALVVPIFKKGCKTVPLNYRPVSLTCIPCKVLEGILKDRLMNETVKAWLNNEQHGFRSGRSTVSNLTEFYDQVTDKLDANIPIDILFFDMAKAFDTVPHSKLIAKMKRLKISNEIIDWTEDYLRDR